MKNRKQLPRFGYLTNINVDVGKIVNHLNNNRLLDWNKYNDIKVSENTSHKDFVVANKFSKNSFFLESNEQSLEGDKYVQLYLTDFDDSRNQRINVDPNASTNIFTRTRRLNPKHDSYLPQADELAYGLVNHHVRGVLAETLSLFSSRITRVRLACLKSGFEIKPHVDYDPSYICRFHIPLITNSGVKMWIERQNNIAEYTMDADGRVYFFNSGLKHWVKNGSNHERLHLIVDVHGQEELAYLETIIF